MSVAVSIHDVTITYQSDAGPVVAAHDVSLDIAAGEVVAIVGPSGCGKTTLLNAVAGFVPFEGSISIGGVAPGRYREFGYLFQQDTLFPWRTLRSNVEFALEVRDVSSPARRQRADALLQQLGLAGFESAYPSQVSGGMAKRAALAQAIVHEPHLILLDEPFGALDAFTRAAVENDFLRIVKTSKATAIFVTHNIGEAVALSDRVIVMSARPGRIVDIIPIDLPKPRVLPDIQYSEHFASYEQEIWSQLAPQVARS